MKYSLLFIDKTHIDKLHKQGAIFYLWNTPRDKMGIVGKKEVLIRSVTSFATEKADGERFIALLD